MKIQTTAKPATGPCDILFILCFEDGKPRLPDGVSIPAGAYADFKGRFRQIVIAYPDGRGKVARAALLGLGKKDKFTTEELRRAAGLVWNTSKDRQAKIVSVMLPREIRDAVGDDAAGCAFAEGSMLASYRYHRFKASKEFVHKEKEAAAAGPQIIQIHAAGAEFTEGIERGIGNAEAANYSRELEDAPANYSTPTALANAAKSLAGGRVQCKILETKDMKRLGMGALLGVAQGSVEPPKFIILHYKPRGKVKETIALIGKGLTFDTGGISIKPSAAMDEMKYDMCGGGAVIGCFHALRNLNLPIEVIGAVPSTENMPGGKAYKPGDVIRACDGTTIEVLNTDAEGRLILCDAIAHVEKTYKPDIIIDLATLTGAIVVALGHEMTGVFANDETLQKELVDAGNEAGERCWPMPLWDAHREQMKSEIADLKNINSPKDGGGAIAGAAFLAHFIKKAKWAHMDIAGTAWGGRERDYLHASGAAGVGVRTLLQFIRNRARD
ncbi:MAG: leucyl aminopeptidase [Planctomycetes bacterium]|nr:leucyl aminopeptidase [Planctomycetota bacterium]